MPLNDQQSRFVDEYLIDLNATQAAIRAGYSAKTAKQQGSRLLTNADVADAVAKACAKRSEETAIDARWVLEQAVDVYGEARREEDRPAALKSLDLVGKHVDIAAFKERVEHTGKDGGPIKTHLNVAGLSTGALEEIMAASDATNQS